jgi:2,4-dienoyl-CoA reductase (NADPH2)
MAARGPRRVTLVRRGARIGDSLGKSARWIVLQELRRLGVRLITGAEYGKVTDEGLLISVGGAEELLEAETIVLAAGYEADPRLPEQWRGAAPEIHVVGDAHIPLKGIDAVYEGTLVGRQI